MSATLALRKKIEAAIAADTGAGGLRQGADGAANVQGYYYERAPANVPDPNIVYSITEQQQKATNFQIVVMTVTFQVSVEQDQRASGAGNTGDFGYTKLDTIRDRLIALFDDVTLAAQDSWTFSPLVWEGRGTTDAGREGRQDRLTVERFTVVANKARSVPTGIVAGSIDIGVGFSIVGKLFTAGPRFGYTSGSGSTTGAATNNFDVQAPFAYRIPQSIGTVEARRETDRYGRVAPTHKNCTIMLAFYPVVGASAPPMLPTGELQTLTLTAYTVGASTAITYSLGTGATALVVSVEPGGSVDGDVTPGRYNIIVNGPLAVTYGPP